MQEALLINPRNKRGQFVKRKRRVNARRRSKKTSARRRRRNPIAAVAAVNPRRRRRRNPIAAVAAVNPRRRKRRYNARSVHGSRRRRRNPRVSFGSFKPRAILNSLIPAGIGAGGALALDIALQYVPLPAMLQDPKWKLLVKLGGALALGYASSFVLGREKAKQVTLGALTVTAYGALREQLKESFPQLGLSGAETYDYSDLRIGYTNPAPMLTGMGAYMQSSIPAAGMGAYMRDSLDSVNSLNGVTNDGM